MAWTVDHPQRRHGWRYQERVAQIRMYHPLSVAGMAMFAALLGAWAGIVTFVGPDFGYRPTTSSAWQWTTANWLLHLIPGAVAVAAGLIITASSRAMTAGLRGLIRLSVLAMLAAGAWLVVGPAAWPIFESSPAYGIASSARMSFAHQIGANLGPGLILVAMAAMILEAVAVSRTTAVESRAAGAATVTGATTAGDAGTAVAPPAEAQGGGPAPDPERAVGDTTEGR
jgi:hypothetical protein